MKAITLIQISPEELAVMIETAVRKAMTINHNYILQFDKLPERISQTQAANFLGVDVSTVRRWRIANKLRFTYETGKNPFINKRQFIEDCRNYNLK